MWKPTQYNSVKNALRKIGHFLWKTLYIKTAKLWKPTPNNSVIKPFHTNYKNKEILIG